MRNAVLSLTLVSTLIACGNPQTTNSSAKNTQTNRGGSSANVELVKDAASLKAVSAIVLKDASSVIIPACDTCDGGQSVTLADVEITYSSCSQLLPLSQRIDYSDSDKKAVITIAAIEVETKTSLVALCAAKSERHYIQLKPGLKLSDITVNALRVQ